MAGAIEDAINVHKTEVVFYDKVNECHYRLNSSNMKKVIFDYVLIKKLFGLKKEYAERIIINTSDPDIPEDLIVCEIHESNFHRFRGGFRTFVDENRIPLEIYDINGQLQN